MAHWLNYLAHLPIFLLTASLGVVMVLDSIPLVGLLIPADAAVMVAMAVRGPVGSVPVVLGVVSGYLASASLGFFIGRHFGPRVRASRFGAWIGEARWTSGELLLAARGPRMLLAAPFLPFVSTLVPLVAGGLRMPYRRFVPAIAVGSMLWTTLYVVLGSVASVVSKSLSGGWVTTLGTVCVGLCLSTFWIRSARRITLPAAPAPC